MNKSVIYIVGATVLVGGAYLFLKNKKEKDLDKLAELDKVGGTTLGGATSSLSNTSDGVSPSDASINLSNAVALVPKRMELYNYVTTKFFGKEKMPILVEIDKKLANLGYKVDNTGLLIKIGVNSSDANVNLANANLLFPKRMDLYRKTRKEFGLKIWGAKLVEIDKKLANLGYKVDATGTLVKI